MIRKRPMIKEIQAQIIRDIADPRKSVVAGCPNGELVRQCRRADLDVYGFDVIPNLKEVAFPQVRDYLRVGSLTEISFDQDDAFDTLVAVDVLEHTTERDLPRMIEEWLRLDVRQLVLLINLKQFWYPGHVTLRPLDWWATSGRNSTGWSALSTDSKACPWSTATAGSTTSSGRYGKE